MEFTFAGIARRVNKTLEKVPPEDHSWSVRLLLEFEFQLLKSELEDTKEELRQCKMDQDEFVKSQIEYLDPDRGAKR